MTNSIIIGSVCLVLGLWIGFILAKRGQGTSTKLSKGLNEVAGGNYAYSFKKHLGTSGSLGEIAKNLDEILVAVNGMIAKMKVSGEQNAYESERVFGQIEVSNQVSSNINSAVEKIAYGSTEQKDHIDIIHTNSDHMRTLATTIAEKCEENHELASSVETGMGEVGNYIDKLIEGIEDSGNVTRTSAEKIYHLKGKIDEISEFITVVTKISEQTNLLALNASIESARAGEAGRGFAVVAEEVRKLAEESKGASEDIVKIVEEVLYDTDQVVAQIDDNKETVANNLKFVRDVKTLVESTSVNVSAMGSDIASIRVITQDQSDQVETIASSIETVASLSNNIASESQEVYAACEEQSASMEEMMSSCEILSKTSLESLNKVKEFSKGIVMSNQAGDRIKDLLNQLQTRAESRDIISMDYAAHKTCMSDLMASEAAFTVVYSADRKTDNLHYINLDLEMDTVAFREWYSQPIKTMKAYTSEIYVPLGSDSPCVTISVPVINSGEVVGVLGADLNLSDIE